ncbi:sigma-70 domain-containing protein [Escherichia coli]
MGREPTPEELAELMLMPEDKIRQSAEDRRRSRSPWKRRLVMMKIRIWDFIEDTTLEPPAGFCDHRRPACGNARPCWLA